MLVEIVARPHCHINDAIKYVYTMTLHDISCRLLVRPDFHVHCDFAFDSIHTKKNDMCHKWLLY